MSRNPLRIDKLNTKPKDDSDIPPLMKEINLVHPFSASIFGCTGSGKTTLGLQLILNKNFYRKFFDVIWLFSPSGGSDPSFKLLGLKKKFIVSENMIEKLGEVFAKQKTQSDRGKAPKTLIIFEDATTEQELMKTVEFKRCFTMNRHVGISVICMCHKYTALRRVCRLNSNNIFIFPCTGSEAKTFQEEYMTPNFSHKRDFYAMMDLAFTKDPDHERPFLWVNSKAEISERFRKGLDIVLAPQNTIEMKEINRPKKRKGRRSNKENKLLDLLNSKMK